MRHQDFKKLLLILVVMLKILILILVIVGTASLHLLCIRLIRSIPATILSSAFLLPISSHTLRSSWYLACISLVCSAPSSTPHHHTTAHAHALPLLLQLLLLQLLLYLFDSLNQQIHVAVCGQIWLEDLRALAEGLLFKYLALVHVVQGMDQLGDVLEVDEALVEALAALGFCHHLQTILNIYQTHLLVHVECHIQ